MKHLKSIMTIVCVVGVSSQTAYAKMSMNDAQGCQAVLDFTIERLEFVEKYNKADVKMVTTALREYENFLQTNHVTPGLAEFTKGDTAAAKEFQPQIDAYKGKVVQGLKVRHPQERIFTDQAVAISNCYTAAPMDAAKLEYMTTAVKMIVTFAKQG